MRQRIARSRAQLLVLATVVLIAALWSVMFIQASSHKTLDQRVQEVASQLECPICQNESVASSPSLLAQQMRMVIRQQLQEGKSEEQVVQYFAHSYGEQIVGTPPWQGFSLLVWLVPIALLLGSAVLVWLTLRDWSAHSYSAVRTGSKPSSVRESDPQPVEDAELDQYRSQLERELAEEDSLFARSGTEDRG